jgi:phosphate transport system ATP-binding protein
MPRKEGFKVSTPLSPPILSIRNLRASFGERLIVKGVSFDVPANNIVALIGPSGCGKSTLLRCLNRLHEEANGHAEGSVLLRGQDIYAPGIDPVEVRSQIGMVFQKPNPFPGLSIWENVVAGLLLSGRRRPRAHLMEIAEVALKQAALWDEVKDKLKSPGASLSGGQQQRLCIARALAVNPAVLLMDEPTSALDPISSARIEELVVELKSTLTVVIVTHNLQQAGRISDYTAFMYLGELVEFDETSTIFTKPRQERTENYITGRFG